MRKYPPDVIRDAVARLHARCEKMPNGCLEWWGATSGPYRRIKVAVDGYVVPGPRAVVEQKTGESLAYMERVIWSCGNRRCLNPEHLSTRRPQYGR